MMALPQNPQEEGDEKKFVEFQAAQKSLDACIKDAVKSHEPLLCIPQLILAV